MYYCLLDVELSAIPTIRMGQIMPLKGVSIRARSMPVRLRYLFLFATVFGGSLLIITMSNHTGPCFFFNNVQSRLTTWSPHKTDNTDNTYTIQTEGCTIPGLQPFDDGVKKFIKYPKYFDKCRNSNFSLLYSNETHIWINRDNIQYYDVPQDANISCCYKLFYRPSAIADISSVDVDERVKYGACIDFTNYIEATNEFVRVSCGYEHKTIYEQFYLFAPKKQHLSYRDDTFDIMQNQTAYNVIVMGIDAISRLNFHRTMPKTLAYLKKKGAIELLGYNKVGDNTFPNLTPMLLGIKDTDLKKTCWPNMRATFDNCPFIWEWYKDAGYYTALGEDSASLGTFNFEKFGFGRTPTDYYIHTFIHEAEINVGNNKDFNSLICMGDKYFYKVLLDYIENLTASLRSSKLFGFFWEVTMSHDYLNYPMLIDDSYEKFLVNLDESHYLDETVLILLSDHGMRWGDIRFTKQGRLEERLPLVQILLPTSFKENFSLAYENIKQNSRRLTTPFDMYATLSDLINLNGITNEKLKSRSETTYDGDRSISLFMPIPGNRTCKMAGIDDHWCTCHTYYKLLPDSKKALEAGTALVKHMNKILRDYSQCAKLVLDKVLEITEMIAGAPRENEVGWREFVVVIRTIPGSGVFEATLRRQNRVWTLAGTISRLNLYGDQSRCVHHYQLKLYCYCRYPQDTPNKSKL